MEEIKQLLATIAAVMLCAGLAVAQEADGDDSSTVIIQIGSARPQLQPGGELETDTRGGEIKQDFSPDEKKKDKWLSFTFENSINYDTNPAMSSTDGKDDWANMVSLSVSAAFFKNENIEMGGQYNFYGEFYSDVEGRDLIGHIGNLYYAKSARPLLVRLDYIYSGYTLDNEAYLRKHTVAPLVLYSGAPRVLDMLRLTFSANEYPGADELDGTDWSIQLRHFLFLDVEKKCRVSIEYKYADMETDDKDESYVSHRIKGDMRFPLIWQEMTALLSLAGTGKEYDGGRDDDKMEYELGVSRSLGKMWAVALKHSSITNESNDPARDYDRNITSFSLKAGF